MGFAPASCGSHTGPSRSYTCKAFRAITRASTPETCATSVSVSDLRRNENRCRTGSIPLALASSTNKHTGIDGRVTGRRRCPTLPAMQEGLTRISVQLAPGIGRANCSILAASGASPLKVRTPSLTEIATWSPSCMVPARIISANGSCTLRWITRLSGRAP